MTAAADERWFLRPVRREGARVTLFCLPYAGGSPNIFRGWAKALPGDVEVVGVRLPGRDNRRKEPHFTAWPQLLAETEEALLAHLGRPFAFFGHSFGARVAFELTKRLEARGGPRPTHLFLSGCRSPHDPPPEPGLHELPREEFLQRVRLMNGTPSEVLQNRPLMDMLEPTLRADMGLHNARWQTSDCPVGVPIVALSGEFDTIDPPGTVRGWEQYGRAGFSFHSFAGDHFFLHTHEKEVLDVLAGAMRQAARPRAAGGVLSYAEE